MEVYDVDVPNEVRKCGERRIAVAPHALFSEGWRVHVNRVLVLLLRLLVVVMMLLLLLLVLVLLRHDKVAAVKLSGWQCS